MKGLTKKVKQELLDKFSLRFEVAKSISIFESKFMSELKKDYILVVQEDDWKKLSVKKDKKTNKFVFSFSDKKSYAKIAGYKSNKNELISIGHFAFCEYGEKGSIEDTLYILKKAISNTKRVKLKKFFLKFMVLRKISDWWRKVKINKENNSGEVCYKCTTYIPPTKGKTYYAHFLQSDGVGKEEQVCKKCFNKIEKINK